VRNRRHIANQRDFQPSALERPNCSLSSRSRPTYHHFNLTHSLIHCTTCGVLSGCLSSKRSTFLGSFETARASRSPGNRFPIGIRNCHNRVVECGLNVGNTARDVLLLLLRAGSFRWLSSHFSSLGIRNRIYVSNCKDGETGQGEIGQTEGVKGFKAAVWLARGQSIARLPLKVAKQDPRNSAHLTTFSTQISALRSQSSQPVKVNCNCKAY
jgi:hypothetical protein